MAAGISYILTILTLLQLVLRMNDQNESSTMQDRLLQHEEQQRQMTWLMEMESCQNLFHLIVCQYCWVLASVEAVLMVAGLYWLPRQKGTGFHSSSQQGSSSSTEEERMNQTLVTPALDKTMLWSAGDTLVEPLPENTPQFAQYPMSCSTEARSLESLYLAALQQGPSCQEA